MAIGEKRWSSGPRAVATGPDDQRLGQLGVADRGEDVLLGGGQGVQLTHLAHDAAKAAALIPMGHHLHRRAVPQPAGIGRGEGRSSSWPLRPE